MKIVATAQRLNFLRENGTGLEQQSEQQPADGHETEIESVEEECGPAGNRRPDPERPAPAAAECKLQQLSVRLVDVSRVRTDLIDKGVCVCVCAVKDFGESIAELIIAPEGPDFRATPT